MRSLEEELAEMEKAAIQTYGKSVNEIDPNYLSAFAFGWFKGAWNRAYQDQQTLESQIKSSLKRRRRL